MTDDGLCECGQAPQSCMCSVTIEPISNKSLGEIEDALGEMDHYEWDYYMGYDAGAWCGKDCTEHGCLGHDLPCAVFEGPSRGCRDSKDPSSRALEFALSGWDNHEILLTKSDARYLTAVQPNNIRALLLRLKSSEAELARLRAKE